MNAYESKRAARISRLQERAANAMSQANRLHSEARSMAAVIPFGQPILVGHHSERRDRNYRARFTVKYEKSFALSDKAARLESRAAAAENNTAISSDDPEAIVKLRAKIKAAEKDQETMKGVNKLIKKKGATVETIAAGMVAMGIAADAAAKLADELMKPDFCGRIGYASYKLTNNNANISRMKKRLEELTAKSQDVETETIINGVRIVENVDENRCQMFFDGKPSESIRAACKSRGFRWSPYNGCWQRQRSNAATWGAELIAGMLAN